ncbi:MAG: hypothetical protein AAF747_07595, partial [Planctomycetota bacterium]
LVRLSSRSQWDVPIRLPDGRVVHLLCGTATDPAATSDHVPADLAARRNHDEIRFWSDYLADAPYIVDDADQPGGLPPNADFVLLAHLAIDPEAGPRFRQPLADVLLPSPELARHDAPTSTTAITGLPDTATTVSGRRTHYILPSPGMGQVRSGIWRHGWTGSDAPSTAFPVWAELRLPERRPDPN